MQWIVRSIWYFFHSNIDYASSIIASIYSNKMLVNTCTSVTPVINYKMFNWFHSLLFFIFGSFFVWQSAYMLLK